MGAYDFNFDLPPGETMAPDAARVDGLCRILPPAPFALAPTVADRAAWDRWRDTAFGARVLKAARDLAAKDYPNLTDAVFLETIKTGDMAVMGQAAATMRARQATFLVAEAIHDTGEFLGVIQSDFARLATIRTWIHPHEDMKRRNFDGHTIEADLTVTHYAENLALTVFVLGPRLSDEFKAQVLAELNRRVFDPLRERVEAGRDHVWWLRIKHNWLSVCLSGFAQAAAAILPGARDRAWWLAFAASQVAGFRDSFTDDGCCTEGVGYWTYGFMHFILLSEVLRCGTGNAIDLIDELKWRRVMLFPERAEIQPGVYPAFADSALGGRPNPWVQYWMANRIGPAPANVEPLPAGVDLTAHLGLHVASEAFLWMFRTRDPLHPVRRVSAPALRHWFDGSAFLICRPGPQTRRQFSATLLGGNNGVNHNHNDLGTFTVIVDGRALIVDPGPEAYTFRTFSERRYDSPLLNSFGHPVPRVAGSLQAFGADWRTRVVAKSFSDDVDRLTFDLRGAYDVPIIQRLTREFIFDRRGDGTLTIVDAVELGEPAAFETALVTFASHTVAGNEIRLAADGAALRVTVTAEGAELEILPEKVDQTPYPTRLALRSKGAIRKATVRAVIRPD